MENKADQLSDRFLAYAVDIVESRAILLRSQW